MSQDKVRENKARRVLARRGFRLMKSRRRDTGAYDFGGYMVVDERTNAIIAGSEGGRAFSFSIGQVEQWIEEYDARGTS